MTRYFCDSTNGSDANNGLSPDASALTDKPYKTIAKAIAAGGAATSGDTVYLAPGIYREAVTVGVTPVSTLSIIGDYANAQGFKTSGGVLVAGGEVRWTAYTTNDTSTPAAFCCKLNGKNFLSFQRIHFVGGTGSGNPGASIDGSSVTGSHDITLSFCAFTHGSQLGSANETHVILAGAVDAASNYTVDGCLFGPICTANSGNGSGSLCFNGPTSSVADYDMNITVKNSVFFSSSGVQFAGPILNPTGANSFKPGGLTVLNCDLWGLCNVKVMNANGSVAYPVKVSNCKGLNDSGALVTGSSPGQLVEDYNLWWSNGPRNNVSIGPFTQATGNYSQLFSYGQETIWGGQLRQFGTPLSGSPILGFGNAILTAGRAATVIDDATVGTIAWTTPTNASVPDGTNTTATSIPITTGKSHYLNAQSFTGFGSIPSDATIKSIRVELIVAAASATAVKCNSVKLLKAGVIVGNDLASSNTTQFSVAATIQSWGSTADPLWGTTWTVAQVQAAGFGCVWSATNTSGSTVTCTVDFIRVIVAYTTADGAGGVAVDLLGNPRPAGGNSTAYAVGALERGNTGTTQSTTTQTTGSAVKITGPGYQDFYMNVDAASVTIGVYARYDTAGQQPTVTLKAAPELGIANDVALTWSDPGANAWAQFTTTPTPTAAGVVLIRCQTAANTGIAYFDTFSSS